MALPSVTLTGTFLNADGSAAAGQVSFTPSAQIVDARDIVVLPQTPVTRSLDSSGAFSVKLLPTDAAGLTPGGWTYTVTIHVGGGTPVTFNILLPSSPNPVDLSAIAPAVPQPALIQYVPVGGGTMTGELTLAGTPPLRIATGASGGYVLTSDASGNASWTVAPAGVPSGTVVSETGYGQAATAGTATAYSRGDHTHGSPTLGTTSSTACAGNDSRLSDSRTPTGSASGDLGSTYPGPTVVATHLASPLPIAQGGTAAATAAQALANLGVPPAPIVRRAYLTAPGNVTLPLTSGAWQVLSGFELDVPAVAGEDVELEASFMWQPSGSSAFLDFGVVTGGTPTIVRYASSGTGAPATAGEGDPALYIQVGTFRTSSMAFGFTAASGDIDTGNVRFVLLCKTTSAAGTVYASAQYPFRWRAINRRTVG